jgi:hypothetical protein
MQSWLRQKKCPGDFRCREKNDQAPDSLEEEEEKEEGEKNGAKKAFSFPFVFVKDLK